MLDGYLTINQLADGVGITSQMVRHWFKRWGVKPDLRIGNANLYRETNPAVEKLKHRPKRPGMAKQYQCHEIGKLIRDALEREGRDYKSYLEAGSFEATGSLIAFNTLVRLKAMELKLPATEKQAVRDGKTVQIIRYDHDSVLTIAGGFGIEEDLLFPAA